MIINFIKLNYKKTILLFALVILTIFAWSPWLTKVNALQIVQTYSNFQSQHNVQKQTKNPEIHVTWLPFCRWVTTYEGGWFVCFWQSPNKNISSLVSDKESLALVIAEFKEENTKSLVEEYLDDLVCAAEVLWETPYSQNSKQKVVYAATTCMNVIVKNDDLYSKSGEGAGAKLYFLEEQNGSWKVIDYDKTEFKAQKKAPWVEEYLKLIPAEAKSKFDPIVLSATLSQKAGELFSIETAKYDFSFCAKDSDCDSDSVCTLHGTSNQGQNKCLKKCSNHTECGKGYSCRGICAKGENGCPETIVNVCQPDLPSDSLDKKDQPW